MMSRERGSYLDVDLFVCQTLTWHPQSVFPKNDEEGVATIKSIQRQLAKRRQHKQKHMTQKQLVQVQYDNMVKNTVKVKARSSR